jgi:hypothetical protein
LHIAVLAAYQGSLLLSYQQLGKVMFNLKFTCNLSATVIFVSLLTLGLAEVHAHPERVAKQKRFSPIGQGIKIGIVIKGLDLR